MKAETFLRRAQLAVGVAACALTFMVVFGGIGTLLLSNTYSSTVAISERYAVVRVYYSTVNPGPLPVSPLLTSVQIEAPNGTAISQPAYAEVTLPPFSNSSGSVDYNLTFAGDSAAMIRQLQAAGEQPRIVVTFRAGLLGICDVTSTFAYNATLAGGT
ncbi:MAG: hypothetical protein JRN39_04870 [Nitrososphaerota archaeon]|nr:hypothetical protein [Nitrososphaerota archaeon]MDG6939716.1 hypothetical protein [Nitrososphaerota archaeon]